MLQISVSHLKIKHNYLADGPFFTLYRVACIEHLVYSASSLLPNLQEWLHSDITLSFSPINLVTISVALLRKPSSGAFDNVLRSHFFFLYAFWEPIQRVSESSNSLSILHHLIVFQWFLLSRHIDFWHFSCSFSIWL